MFDPVSKPLEDFMRVPTDVKVYFIDNDEKVKHLDLLKGQKYLGISCKYASGKDRKITLMLLGGQD